MRDNKPLIVGICHYIGGQKWYRLENPLRAIQDSGIAETHIVALNEEGDYKDLPTILADADLVIWQNPAGSHTLRWIKIIQDQMGVPVAVDMDDHNLAITPDNEAYLALGRKKEVRVVDPDKRLLYHWRDGETYGGEKYDVAANAGRIRYQMMCLREATAVICSTYRLMGTISQFKTWKLNPPGAKRDVPIWLLPNMIDSQKWPHVIPQRARTTVRILWQGGTSHTADLYLIRDALKEILFRCPEARLVILGGPWSQKFLIGMPKHQVETHKGVRGNDEYIKKLVELDVDIGLAPLCDTVFNHCKSAVKFLQYTMLGIPTIASDVPPYSDTIEMEGEGQAWSGILADGAHAWVEGLWQLVKSAEMRLALVRNARNWVRVHGDIHAPHVPEQLAALFGGIIELSRSLPGARDPARS